MEDQQRSNQSYSGEFQQSTIHSNNTYHANNINFGAQVSSNRPSQQEIIEWISDLNFFSTQQDNLSKRQEGTGGWLLETPEFQNWFNSDSGILFCHGIRGSGKTILMSTVVEHLQDMLQGSERDGAVLFVYLSQVHEERDNALAYFAALARQILQCRQEISQTVKDFYKTHFDRNTRPIMSQWVKLLTSEAAHSNGLYIVVDALDEVAETTRSSLISNLLKLQRNAPSVRLLFTSRDIEASREMGDAVNLEILARDDDIAKFIEGEIQEKANIKKLARRDRSLVELIKQKLTQHAHGMFLLAYLHLQVLESSKKTTKTEFRQLLDNLPPVLNKTYEALWYQILAQDDHDVEIAKKVLTWICFATEPLNVDAIKHALRLSDCEATDLDEDNLMEEGFLISPCCGLVRIEQNSRKIGFAHYTAQDFFPLFLDDKIPDAHLQIASVCIRHFQIISFDYTPNDMLPGRLIEQMLAGLPLLDYAIRKFGYHAELSTTETWIESLLTLFQDQLRMNSLLSICWYRGPFTVPSTRTNFSVRNTSGLHIAAFFNLISVAGILLDRETYVDLQDGLGWPPIRWAVLAGAKPMVFVLVERGADLNYRDNEGLTTLMWALGPLDLPSVTHDISVQEGGRHIHLGNIVNLSPLVAQARNTVPFLRTNQEIIECLVDLSPDINIGGHGASVLDIAASNQMRWLVPKLLSRGACSKSAWRDALENSIEYVGYNHHGSDRYSFGSYIIVNAEDPYQLDSADYDSQDDGTWICSLISDEEINARCTYEQSILSVAAEKGYTALVQHLIERGAEVNCRDIDGRTPLMYATRRPGQQTLRASGFNLSGKCHGFIGVLIEVRGDFTSLEHATESPFDEIGDIKASIVRLLIENGADVSATDNAGLSAFDIAQAEGMETVCGILREHGATPTLVNVLDLPWLSVMDINMSGQAMLVKNIILPSNHQSPLPWLPFKNINASGDAKLIENIIIPSNYQIHSQEMEMDINMSGNAQLIRNAFVSPYYPLLLQIAFSQLAMNQTRIRDINLSGQAKLEVGFRIIQDENDPFKLTGI